MNLKEFETQLESIESASIRNLEDVQKLQVELNKHADKIPKFYLEKFSQRLQALRVPKCRPRKARQPRAAPQNAGKPTPLESSNTRNIPEGLDAAVNDMKSQDVVIPPQPDLKLTNMINSIVIASDIETSLYCDNLRDCKLYVCCQQCRLFNCTNLEIYIDGCSTPVLEHSSGIRFYFKKETPVCDFQWPNPLTASPNYLSSILSPWVPISQYTLEELTAKEKSIGGTEKEEPKVPRSSKE
ncbi:hypothetical protein DASB73_020880 [Starmerella bacillaris]|uniref:C-CAP/cofactor C-like domain-containing protein n=1 Tax=Starmerella bacillaris TaxID=1247836 RepID=A0AAV5RHX9_STABA|nr:hypothetical protein DASB73_020880 [Starmerella bacillaris]